MRLTRKGFRAYLEAHPEETFYARSACYCPLAKYALSQVPAATIAFVGSEDLDVQAGDTVLYHQQLAPWAKRFVETFDRSKPVGERESSAADALTVLDAA